MTTQTGFRPSTRRSEIPTYNRLPLYLAAALLAMFAIGFAAAWLTP